MSDCVTQSTKRVKFFRPAEVRTSEALEFFRSVLAVYGVEVVEGDRPGEDLLAWMMDSSGSFGARMRHPFLHAERLEEFAYDTENIISTAIPIRGSACDLYEVLKDFPRNRNREGYMTSSALPWILAYASPATAYRLKVAIEDAEQQRQSAPEASQTQGR